MKQPLQRLKEAHIERNRFRRRAIIGFGLLLVLMLGLCARFFWLQVVQYDEYRTRSRANRVHVHVLSPPRGLIYDRNGVLLADNIPAFRLDVVPEKAVDVDHLLERLGHYIPLSDTEIQRFKQRVNRSHPFQKVPLKLQLSEAEINRFMVNRWRFPSVNVEPYLKRYYPQGKAFAHILGYVGRINAKELASVDKNNYAGTNYFGKRGIEAYYESRLHGKPGYRTEEVNVDQRIVSVMSVHPPTPGESLYLTLDTQLQKAAVGALHGRPGAVVAIDPRNGQVLAMVSQPSFDPNLFVNGISVKDYKGLLNNPDKPLLDRALRGRYPPGSTIKPFLGLGGLELGYRTPEDTVFSTGVYHIPGYSRGFRDDQRYGAGRVNVVQAIAQSVNTYFYKLAHDMGIDVFSQWMGQFGFGAKTGIDLYGEGKGVLPSRQWKRVHRHAPWYPGETVIAGIGQGYWVVTPLQLAHAVAILANDGTPYRPHLLAATRKSIQGDKIHQEKVAPGKSIMVKQKDWDVVRKGMLKTVYGKGTARGLGKNFPYKIAGKTGTAERYSRTTDAYESHDDLVALSQRHRALFIAYAPADDPQIAVAVIVDHGAWGSSTAAPVARAVLDAWLKEKRKGDLNPAITGKGSS